MRSLLSIDYTLYNEDDQTISLDLFYFTVKIFYSFREYRLIILLAPRSISCERSLGIVIKFIINAILFFSFMYFRGENVDEHIWIRFCFILGIKGNSHLCPCCR